MLILLYYCCFYYLICSYFDRNYDQAPEDVLPACLLTLHNLQLDYLDLYLIHTPFRIEHSSRSFPFPEEARLMYDEEKISKTWKVRFFYKTINIFNLAH